MTTSRNVFFLCLSISLLWSGCSSDPKEKKAKESGNFISVQDTANQITNLSQIYDHLSSPPETIHIDPTKDTLLKCKKGTMLYFPANAFQLSNGNSPTGSIQIDVKECYTLADFIGNNLSTTSGNKLLETGGMVNISVSSNGQPLTMKADKELALYFPKNGQKGDMQLFYGNHLPNGQIDWTPASVSPTKQKNSIDNINIENPTYSCQFVIDSRIIAIDNIEIQWKMKDSDLTLFDYFSDNFSVPDKMKKDYCNRFYEVIFYIKLDALGKVSKVVFTKASSPEMDKFISDFLYAMPPLDITSMAKYSPSQTYFLSLRGQTKRDNTPFIQQFKKKYASFRDKAITKIDQAELNYYVLTATNLKWINCDRFVNTRDKLIEFQVTPHSPNETQIIIVFKKTNSVMQGKTTGNRTVFSNIPMNQAIKVIGISYDNGKPTMAVAETTTDKDGFQLTDFKEFTLNQLEATLNKPVQ